MKNNVIQDTMLIYPSWPQWTQAEEAALIDAVDSGYWGPLGKRTADFTMRFADYLGVAEAIAVNNGTQALEILLRGCGIGRGDEVIVPPYSFVATASAVAYVGAMPVFADVDPMTGCIDAASVQQRITANTKAVIAVHVAGRPCDMDALLRLTRAHDILLLEDAAHAHGSMWQGKYCGALGDAAAFSFQASKALTGGEGGMIVTSRRDIYERCWHYHHSGRALVGGAEFGGLTLMGTNARMAEWTAAILNEQINRLEEQCSKRTASARLLAHCLSQCQGIELPADDQRMSKWNGYIFQFFIKAAQQRDRIVATLCEQGIPCSAGYRMLTDMGFLYEPAFEKATGRIFADTYSLPNARQLSLRSVWIPGYVLLSDKNTLIDLGERIVGVVTNTIP